MIVLTDRQADILTFIREHWASYGYAPSYRQIGAAVGLVSVSSVRYQLGVLAAAGYLRLAPGTARAIVLLDPEPEPAAT